MIWNYSSFSIGLLNRPRRVDLSSGTNGIMLHVTLTSIPSWTEMTKSVQFFKAKRATRRAGKIQAGDGTDFASLDNCWEKTVLLYALKWQAEKVSEHLAIKLHRKRFKRSSIILKGREVYRNYALAILYVDLNMPSWNGTCKLRIDIHVVIRTFSKQTAARNTAPFRYLALQGSHRHSSLWYPSSLGCFPHTTSAMRLIPSKG